jgi:hypothetical protein
MEIAKAKITVNGAEVGVTVDEHGIATIPCVKNDVVDIDFTTETAIEAIAAGNVKNGAIYDLQGRRVPYTHSLKGIFIVNGRKVIIK